MENKLKRYNKVLLRYDDYWVYGEILHVRMSTFGPMVEAYEVEIHDFDCPSDGFSVYRNYEDMIVLPNYITQEKIEFLKLLYK